MQAMSTKRRGCNSQLFTKHAIIRVVSPRSWRTRARWPQHPISAPVEMQRSWTRPSRRKVRYRCPQGSFGACENKSWFCNVCLFKTCDMQAFAGGVSTPSAGHQAPLLPTRCLWDKVLFPFLGHSNPNQFRAFPSSSIFSGKKYVKTCKILWLYSKHFLDMLYDLNSIESFWWFLVFYTILSLTNLLLFTALQWNVSSKEL